MDMRLSTKPEEGGVINTTMLGKGLLHTLDFTFGSNVSIEVVSVNTQVDDVTRGQWLVWRSNFYGYLQFSVLRHDPGWLTGRLFQAYRLKWGVTTAIFSLLFLKIKSRLQKKRGHPNE
jgi:hypothetical protein